MQIAISASRCGGTSGCGRTRATAAADAPTLLTHLTLAPGEVARLPRGTHRLRAIRGTAYVTYAGRDLLIWPGEPPTRIESDARAERALGPALVGPLGDEEIVLEFEEADAREGTRWMTALLLARPSRAARAAAAATTRFWTR